HKIIFGGICTLLAWFDKTIVDGFFNSLAWVTHRCSYMIKDLQNGNVQSYAIIFLWGLVIILVAVLFFVFGQLWFL
ncbi:MAG: NADH-quinone oxidoreductase subunit L, partial [Bacteroides sp.]|nr:NADH-quinone oxidoreductase subunit L [Bacteroides sp.]